MQRRWLLQHVAPVIYQGTSCMSFCHSDCVVDFSRPQSMTWSASADTQSSKERERQRRDVAASFLSKMFQNCMQGISRVIPEAARV
jgi:hypothetical protein